MELPKFSFTSTIPLPAEPDHGEIHTGRTVFSTQNVAVYPDFVMVAFPDRILRIEVKCTKAFCKGESIALLTDNLLKTYEGMKHRTSHVLSDALVELINDYIPDDLMSQLVETKDISAVFDGAIPTALFMPYGQLMLIFPDKIIMDGNEIPNSIHSEHCKYLVTWYNKNIIVSNTHSDEFIYISDGKQILPEECDALSLRVNEDFDVCHLEDMNIEGDSILLKDPENLSRYKIHKFTGHPKTHRSVVFCTVTDDEITVDGNTMQNYTTGEKTMATSEKISINKVLDRHSTTTSNKEFISSTKDEVESSSMNLTQGLKGSLFSSKSSVEPSKDKTTTPPREAEEPTDSEIIRKTTTLRQFLESEIQSLSNDFKGLARSPSDDIEILRYVPCKYDLHSLYNKVYSNNIEEYKAVLDGLIISAELMRDTRPHNVEESLKYFDRRIKGKGRLIGCVKYKYPLTARFTDVMDVKPRHQPEPVVADGKLLSLQSIGAFQMKSTYRNIPVSHKSEPEEHKEKIKAVSDAGNISEVKNEMRELTLSGITANRNLKDTESFKAMPVSRDFPPSLFEAQPAAQSLGQVFPTNAANNSQPQHPTLFSGAGLFQNALPSKPAENNVQPDESSALSRFASSRRMFK